MEEPSKSSAEKQKIAEWIERAKNGSNSALGRALESCRNYLLLVAEREIGGDLRSKGGASDLVQETFVDAQKGFAQFRGQSEEELLAWLRQILVYNVTNFSRRYRETESRRVDREV